MAISRLVFKRLVGEEMQVRFFDSTLLLIRFLHNGYEFLCYLRKLRVVCPRYLLRSKIFQISREDSLKTNGALPPQQKK